MRKVIDFPDEHLDSLKKAAKIKGQSVKKFIEMAAVALTFQTLTRAKK